jgi:hypothetical protein
MLPYGSDRFQDAIHRIMVEKKGAPDLFAHLQVC